MIHYIESDLVVEKNYIKYDYIISPMNIYNNFDKYWGSLMNYLFPHARKLLLEAGRGAYGNKKQLGNIVYTRYTEPYKGNDIPTNLILCIFLKGFNFRPHIEGSSENEYDYDALAVCLEKIKIIFGGNGKKFCIPRFDKLASFKKCDWNKVESLLNKYLYDEEIYVYTKNHKLRVNYLFFFRRQLREGKLPYLGD